LPIRNNVHCLGRSEKTDWSVRTLTVYWIGVPSTPDAQQINSVNSPAPDDIMQVQSRLIDLRYMIGPPDGLWGNKSRQALRAFKADNGI
jgi:peptidoglycan hydrolase-like protein with peptidoglycan-binding domain